MLYRKQIPLYFFLEHSQGKENLGTKKDGDFERITINEIENDSKEPITVNRAKMNIRKTIEKIPETDIDYNIKTKIEDNRKDNTEEIVTNMERLNEMQRTRLREIIETNKEVFDKDLSTGYNQKSGRHYCNLKFANEERPSSRKVNCVQYNSQMNVLLQQVCDQLTEANVLGIPQQDFVDVQHVMPCFLNDD